MTSSSIACSEQCPLSLKRLPANTEKRFKRSRMRCYTKAKNSDTNVCLQPYAAPQSLELKVDIVQPVKVFHHFRTDIVFVIFIALATKDPLAFLHQLLAFLSLSFLTGLPCDIPIVPMFSGYVTAPGECVQGRC